MDADNELDGTVCDNLLAEAARRSLPAELVVVCGDNLQANLKTKFLAVQPERLLLELPSNNGRPAVLQTGQFIEVYFKVGHERFGFDSRVIGHSRLELAGQHVEAVDLAVPHFLEARQRRKFSRVSVATLPPIAARLWPVCMDAHECTAIDGRLCNLSAGGVAVVVDRQRWQFTCDRQFRLAFTLPGDADEFQFNAVVCHVRHVFQSRRQIVGLAFLPGDESAAHREAIERVARFVETQQRGGQMFARQAGAS